MGIKLSNLLSGEEYELFLRGVRKTAESFADIIGVLCVGSLVQPAKTPDDFFIPRSHTARGLAYERIRNPGRRRLAIHEGSDLDIWICTRDTDASRSAQERVERSAIILLGELVSGTIERGSERWHKKKRTVLGRDYKNLGFYSEDFVAANGGSEPWMARQFKVQLEAFVVEYIPAFAAKVNQHFDKKLPGDFLEIRAFPESLFHLRPDDSVMPNMQEDRMPFPRIANDQWISPKHSSLVAYTSDDVTIYPFKENGRILGSRIADYLDVSETVHTGKAYGSIVIKSDAIFKKQVDIIMEKIYNGIRDFNGRIVWQKTLDTLTETDIETMYPFLKGTDLQEAKTSLVGGEMIILIIESDIPAGELFRRINSLKGSRLIERSYERLMEGRTLRGNLRDLLPIPGEEDLYKAILPTILAKKADPTVRFSDEHFKYYAQNLVHSPDNEVELQGLFLLAGFAP